VRLHVLLPIVTALVEVELSTIATLVSRESLILKVDGRHLLLSSLYWWHFERRQARRIFNNLLKIDDSFVVQDHRHFSSHGTTLFIILVVGYIAENSLPCSLNDIVSKLQLLGDS